MFIMRIIKKHFTLTLVIAFLLLPVFSFAQSENALARGEWRRALNKCLEYIHDRDDYGVYKGEIEQYGIYEYEKEQKYRSGTGIYKWNDGSIYIGGWSGIMEGLGIYIVPEGYNIGTCPGAAYYVGEWYIRKSGLGMCYDSNGNLIYVGDFENDYPTDQYPMSGFTHDKFECKEYSGGNYYVGMTKDGKPDGIGFFVWKSGTLWFGEWENGARNGYGVLISYEGKVTSGTWKGDKKE